MKQIRDAFMEWLDKEIMSLALLPDRTVTHEDEIRQQALLDAKEKLMQIIAEEFSKLTEDNHEKL